MTALKQLLESPAVTTLGWVLLHALWQGALIGALLQVGLRLLRHRSAQARYLSACLALLGMVGCSVFTFIRIRRETSPSPAPSQSAWAYTDAAVLPASVAPGVSNQLMVYTEAPPDSVGAPVWYETLRAQPAWHRSLPWLALAWMVGVALGALRLFGGCLLLERRKRQNTEPAPAPWTQCVETLAHRFRISRPVRLALTSQALVPTVIGCYRAVILMPTALLSGLSPAHVEALLAHELAHIRRYDHLVNLAQALIETLFFFHPVAWWISQQIRLEREVCCDELVIAVCNDRLTYARALASLEALRSQSVGMALAGNGGDLMARIRHILGLPPQSRAPWSERASDLLLVVQVAAIVLVVGMAGILRPSLAFASDTERVVVSQTQAFAVSDPPALVYDGTEPLTIVRSRPASSAERDNLPTEAREPFAQLDQTNTTEPNDSRLRALVQRLKTLQDAYTRAGKLDEAVAIRDGLQEFEARRAGAQPDPGNPTAYRGQVGLTVNFLVTGRLTGSVWGNGVYTDDSDMGTVAVHAGLLKDGQTGIVKVTILDGQDSYDGLDRNGVLSRPYGIWPGSYVVQPGDLPIHFRGDALPEEARKLLAGLETANAPEANDSRLRAGLRSLQKLQDTYARAGKLDEAVAIRDQVGLLIGRLFGAQPDPGNLTQYRGQIGRVLYFVVTGHTAGPVWGEEVYTDDSNLGTAAVHAGLLHAGQKGVLKVTIMPGYEGYAGSDRNGVSSMPYAAWGGSYRVEGVKF